MNRDAVIENDGSQAVQLPARSATWDDFKQCVADLEVPDDFLSPASRQDANRDLFEDID